MPAYLGLTELTLKVTSKAEWNGLLLHLAGLEDIIHSKGEPVRAYVGVSVMNNRIEVDPHICHGQPCIRGTRVMVYLIIELLEAGLTPANIIRDYYPQITMEDVQACLHYAADY